MTVEGAFSRGVTVGAMAEFRHIKRTHSDPDMPSLIPLPARPHSSYKMRPADKLQTQFDQRIISEIAAVLGVDLEANGDFTWVVRDCLLALKDQNWQVQFRDNDIVYVNTQSDECRSFHQLVELHRQLAQRLLHEDKLIKTKRMDPHYRIKELVFSAIMGEKDVRRVATPQLITEIMSILKVDTLTEPFLIRRVKVMVEEAYFKMFAAPQSVTLDTCIDVQNLTILLELDRVAFLRKISPSGLMYCVECEAALADTACAHCHDVLCNACCAALHSTGHRQDHPQVFIEQCVCSECEQRSAVIRCQDCADLFCYDCFKHTHKAGKRCRHCVRLPFVTYCFECDEREASYVCMECEDVLCTKCSSHIHRRGARQNHTLFGLRKAAYPKKLFADNLDRVMQILSRNIDQTLPLSPWYLFYDEAVNPYWFNFHTREHKRVPKDGAFLIPPDHEQVYDTLGTQAAWKASESAVFHVPPPVHIKFSTPSMQQNQGGPIFNEFTGLGEEIHSLQSSFELGHSTVAGTGSMR